MTDQFNSAASFVVSDSEQAALWLLCLYKHLVCLYYLPHNLREKNKIVIGHWVIINLKVPSGT